jgi:ribonuclease HI
MGLDAMRPTYNLEPKYRVTLLTRENWTRGSGAPPEIKGLIWYTDGSKMKEGTGAGVFGQTVRSRLSFSLGRYTTVFQAEIFAILACAYEIQSKNRSEKYVSICSDSQAALRALNAAKTTSPLVRQCQEALNNISARHVVGLYWVPGHAGVQGNVIADGLARGGSASRFLGPEPVLWVSRRVIRTKLNDWLINQHWASWRDLGHTQRQARELISGPRPGYKAKFLSFNRTQTRVVTGLLTGHNTLRRHLHLLKLVDSPLCRRCGVKEETSAHILCECEALASLRHTYLGSFFLEPEDIRHISLGAVCGYGRATGLL